MSPLTVDWLDDLLPHVARPDACLLLLQEGQPEIETGAALPAPRAVTPGAAGWQDAVREAMTVNGESCCLIYPVVAALPGTLAWRVEGDGGELRDEAALVAAAVDASPPGRTVAAFVSQSLLTQGAAAGFRKWLASRHRPSWIVYLGPSAARAMGVSSNFAMALLVVETGTDDGEKTRCMRLADLRELERDAWAGVLAAAAKRRGGEVGSSIVLRDPELDGGPWTYERFSRRFEQARADARELGAFRTLGQLAASLRQGVQLKLLSGARVRVDEGEPVPEGVMRCYGVRSFDARGLLERPYYVRGEEVPEELRLAVGDVLVRLLAHPRHQEHPLATVEIREEHLPATFERRVLALRFGAGVDPQVKELVVGYLRSRHARDWLLAHGVGGNLSASQLAKLEVPYPRDEVLEAFSRLREAESSYLGWAREARQARQELFDASRYAETVPRLLERVRRDGERVRAAHDSQSLDYMVRNYYPHPIALRREKLLQEAHGELRLAQTLECAEHLLALLGVLAMVQVVRDHDVTRQVTEQIRFFARRGALRLDWGGWLNLLAEGAKATARHANPLTLPFPELGGLAWNPEADEPPAWHRAQDALRRQRNDRAHLQRPPGDHLAALSKEMGRALDEVLATASFLGTCRLVHVDDYELDPITGERRAVFVVHQGTSAAFGREERPVDAELARGAVGVLDHHGRYRALAPWLLLAPCPSCKAQEVFILSGYGSGTAIYVAMETGHPLEKPELAPRWEKLLGSEE